MILIDLMELTHIRKLETFDRRGKSMNLIDLMELTHIHKLEPLIEEANRLT